MTTSECTQETKMPKITPSDWRSAVASARSGNHEPLETLFESAPWGRNGNVFVDSSFGPGLRRRCTWLYIQGRRVAYYSPDYGVVVLSSSEGELRYQESRCSRRYAADKYAALRQEFLDAAYLGGELSGWVYEEGKEGGTFRRPRTAEEKAGNVPTKEAIGAGRIIARLGYNPLEPCASTVRQRYWDHCNGGWLVFVPRNQRREWGPRTRDRKRPPRDLRMTA